MADSFRQDWDRSCNDVLLLEYFKWLGLVHVGRHSQPWLKHNIERST